MENQSLEHKANSHAGKSECFALLIEESVALWSQLFRKPYFTMYAFKYACDMCMCGYSL